MTKIELIPDKETYTINDIIENTKRIYNFNFIKTTEEGKKIHLKLRNKFANELKKYEKIHNGKRLVEYKKEDVLKLFNHELENYFKKFNHELGISSSFYITTPIPNNTKDFYSFSISDTLDSQSDFFSKQEKSLNGSTEIALINGYAICELLEESSKAMNPLTTPEYISNNDKFKLRKEELRNILNLKRLG